MKPAKAESEAEVLREYVPLERGHVHGVTFDGKLVWFARDDELVAFDPGTEQVVRRHRVPGARAGTAYDGEHLYQLAQGEILVVQPSDGRIVRRMRSPCKGDDSGMAWADGYLWIGQYRQSQIHKVDAKTGEIVKTLDSDRFVTGVSCVDGAIWHASSGDGQPSALRRVAPDGSVEESLAVPVKAISGLEAAGDGTFWCGGEGGTLRRLRPRSKG
jgi:hypothetical protein